MHGNSKIPQVRLPNSGEKILVSLLWISLPLLCSLGLAVPLHAQDQVWTSVSLRTDLSDDTSVSGQLEFRTPVETGESDRLAATFLVDQALSPRVSVGGGFAYRRSLKSRTADTVEYRPFQQVEFMLTDTGSPISVASRARLEQRFRSSGEIGLRMRNRVSFSYGLSSNASLRIWTEPYFHLDNPNTSGERGLDQWRNYLGLRYDLSERTSLNAGYLNQFDRREDGTQSLDIAIISVASSF